MEAHGQDGNEHMLGNEQGDDAGDGAEAEKPGGQENRDGHEGDLPKPEMHALERSIIAQGRRLRGWSYGCHDRHCNSLFAAATPPSRCKHCSKAPRISSTLVA